MQADLLLTRPGRCLGQGERSLGADSGAQEDEEMDLGFEI